MRLFRRPRHEEAPIVIPELRLPAPVATTPPELPAAAAAASPWVVAAVPDFSGRAIDDIRTRIASVAVAYRLTFSTGEIVDVHGDGVVGRNPTHDGDYVHRIAIPDEGRSLSRSHFEFGVTPAGAFWVRDLESGNGTRFAAPGHPDRELESGARTAVPRGAVVRFGAHSMTVAEAKLTRSHPE